MKLKEGPTVGICFEKEELARLKTFIS